MYYTDDGIAITFVDITVIIFIITIFIIWLKLMVKLANKFTRNVVHKDSDDYPGRNTDPGSNTGDNHGNSLDDYIFKKQ